MPKDDVIQEAVAYFGGVWPPSLWTGVMFFNGYRITKQEFYAATKGQS